VPSEGQRVYVVWLPALLSDTRGDAIEASSECDDPRVRYFWDEGKNVGNVFGSTLKLDRFALDVYLVYERGVTWKEGAPSRPDFWMHQLGGLEDRAPTLDSLVLRQKIEELVSNSSSQ
jgi:hypothetical protein